MATFWLGFTLTPGRRKWYVVQSRQFPWWPVHQRCTVTASAPIDPLAVTDEVFEADEILNCLKISLGSFVLKSLQYPYSQ